MTPPPLRTVPDHDNELVRDMGVTRLRKPPSLMPFKDRGSMQSEAGGSATRNLPAGHTGSREENATRQ